MNLHIVEDEKFINGAIAQFEKYSPNQNIFIINTLDFKLKYVQQSDNVVALRLSNKEDVGKVYEIVKNNAIKRVFIHHLTPLKAAISNVIKRKYNISSFWIFYGADLYLMLNKYHGYELLDSKPASNKSIINTLRLRLSILKFYYFYKNTPRQEILNYIKNLNYFCFWNNYDYELLKKYYNTDATHLDFMYFNALNRDLKPLKQYNSITIMINNSASINGNHATILNKINRLDKNNDINQIIVPLSYGNKDVVRNIKELGDELFNKRFYPLLDFLELQTYFELLDTVSVAFFGSRRQEAAGNVTQLLANGVKVFLRNENNMMKYYRDKGFVLFSFEDDFNSIDDIRPLTNDEMEQNRSAFLNTYNLEYEIQVMSKILNT